MDKKYCENCRHMSRADEYETYSDQIKFARCVKYVEANVFANVSMAFDTTSFERCANARNVSRLCGPEAKGYEELT